MNKSDRYVVFTLDEQQYALCLRSVSRILRAVEVTPLPKAPDIVLGIINIQGRIIPAVNIRRRFRLPEREIELSDRLIVVSTTRRAFALVVDDVVGVIEHSEETMIPAEEILPGLEYVKGIAKLKGGMILIHNIDEFLSLEEDKKTAAALSKA